MRLLWKLAYTASLALLTSLVVPRCVDAIQDPDLQEIVFGVYGQLGRHLAVECATRPVNRPAVCDGLSADVSDVFYSPLEGCSGCMAALTPIVELIQQGYSYEDMRPILIPLCERYFNESRGENGTAMCPGVMDNFAPHAHYIINTTGMDANELCLALQICHLDDFTTESVESRPGVPSPYQLRDQHTTWTSHLQRTLGKAGDWLHGRGRRGRDLEGVIKVAQITDIHVDLEYAEGSATECGLIFCCRERWSGEGSARRYGDRGCEIPPLTVDLALNFTRSQDVDFVLFTGDNNPSAIWEETLEIQIEGTRWLAAEMDLLLGKYGIPTYPVIGNHEMHPTNQYYVDLPETQEFNAKFAEYWQPVAGFPEDQMTNIEYAGFYTVLQRPGLRVLGYNSNFGYTDNWYNLFTLFDKEEEGFWNMLTFMDDTMAAARQAGEKVILIGHHPTGDRKSQMTYSDEILDLLQRYSDVIVLHVFGHYHRDNYKLVWDADYTEVVGVQLALASMTTNRNPSVRIYYLDPDTFQLLDFDNYFLQFEESADLEPDISLFEFVYRASEEYGMDDLSPWSWMDLTFRMIDDVDLFNQYYYNAYTRNGGTCTGSCKDDEICRIVYASWEPRRLCEMDN